VRAPSISHALLKGGCSQPDAIRRNSTEPRCCSVLVPLKPIKTLSWQVKSAGRWRGRWSGPPSAVFLLTSIRVSDRFRERYASTLVTRSELSPALF
jgi:hypothetical protein